MRTLKHVSLALLMIILAISGCKKDEIQNPANSPDALPGARTTKLLLAFRDNLKLKSVGSLPIDSATWYLEGLLNYENANNDHKFINLNYISDSIVIYTGGNAISTNDLNMAYEYLNARLLQEANLHNNSLYKFDLVDLEIVSTGLKSGETVITMVASGGLNLVGVYLAFEPDDYWKWGWNLGKCDGSITGVDAADLLEQRFNDPAIVDGGVGDGYFVDVEMHTAVGGSSQFYDPDYPGSWHHNMMFAASGTSSAPPEEPCLTPTELNYHLSKFPFISDYYKPLGKTFKNIDITESMIPGSGYWGRMHDYNLYYGIFILNNTNPN